MLFGVCKRKSVPKWTFGAKIIDIIGLTDCQAGQPIRYRSEGR
jgi:hypothetical protein